MSRRDSMHDAVRDFLEGFGGEVDANFNTVSTRDQVAVGPDDDLEQEVADNGGNTSYIISGTHRVNLNISYDNIALIGDPESRPTLELGPNTTSGGYWSDPTGNVIHCTGNQTDAQNDTDPIQQVYLRDLDIDGRLSDSDVTFQPPSGSDNSAVFFRHVEDIYVERCRFDDCRIRALNVMTTPHESNDRCWVINNVFTNNHLNATHISANSAVVSGNFSVIGDDTAYEFGQLESVIMDSNYCREFQTGAILTQLDDFGVVSNNILHVAGTGLSINKHSGNDVNRPLVTGNIFYGDENADANLSQSLDPNAAVSVDGSRGIIEGNIIRYFNNGLLFKGGTDWLVSSNTFIEPRAGGMVEVTQAENSVSDLAVVGNYFDGTRGSNSPSPSSPADGVDTGTINDVFVQGNFFKNTNSAVVVGGTNGYVGGNRMVTYNNAVNIDGGDSIEVAYNHFRNGDFRGIWQHNGGDNGLYHHNHGTSSPNNVIVIDSNSAEWWENIGHRTENTGTATVSGDGTATTFNIGAHGLLNGPTNPADTRSNIAIGVTPVSADAVSAAPVTGYPVDPGADGSFEDIEIVFASAPASGTDNVEVRWEARMAGVRGR